MLRILLCSTEDLRGHLARTIVGRQGIEVYTVHKLDDARLLAATLSPQAILVDRDLPGALEFVHSLRSHSVTRRRSIALLARGEMRTEELELLDAGANAILRLPPDDQWDERLARLLQVPERHEARVPAHATVDGLPGGPATVVNLSASGMLLACAQPLTLGQEVEVAFDLAGSPVRATMKVVRQAGSDAYGVEFLHLADAAREAVRGFLRSATVEKLQP